MTNPIRKKLYLDVQWCLDNVDSLSLEQFARKFGYLNKHNANNRYKDILLSNAFKNCDSLKELLFQFEIWKDSANETSFWSEVTLDSKKRQVETTLQGDGYETAAHFSLQASSDLRKTRPFDLPPLESNKRLKNNNHEEPQLNQTLSNTTGTNDGNKNKNQVDEAQPKIVLDELEEDPKSDLSIDHHPQRKGTYYIMQESPYSNSDEDEDESVNSDAGTAWIINNIDLVQECSQYREDCLSKRRPQELDDIALLAINHIYVFAELVSQSVTRHFDCIDSHHKIIHSLNVSDNVPNISPNVYQWCLESSLYSGNDWKEMQRKTVKYINEAINSENNLDLIIANIIHRILPSIKISGYVDQRGEDSFVHDVLSPLLDIVFSFDPCLNHFWANVGLDDLCKEFKPDYGVYANGLSKRFVVLVAEFKPKEGRQQQESDLIKIGKQMRIMLNKLLEIGVENPVVCSIIVRDDKLTTYKMHLQSEKIYVMTQLCSVKIAKSSDDLVLLPGIVSRLCQLKDISVDTIKSLHTRVKNIKNGKAIIESSVPDSSISKTFYTLARQNAKPERQE